MSTIDIYRNTHKNLPFCQRWTAGLCRGQQKFLGDWILWHSAASRDVSMSIMPITLGSVIPRERKERAFTRAPLTERSEEMGNVRASSDGESAPPKAEVQRDRRSPDPSKIVAKRRISLRR